MILWQAGMWEDEMYEWLNGGKWKADKWLIGNVTSMEMLCMGMINGVMGNMICMKTINKELIMWQIGKGENDK